MNENNPAGVPPRGPEQNEEYRSRDNGQPQPPERIPEQRDVPLTPPASAANGEYDRPQQPRPAAPRRPGTPANGVSRQGQPPRRRPDQPAPQRPPMAGGNRAAGQGQPPRQRPGNNVPPRRRPPADTGTEDVPPRPRTKKQRRRASVVVGRIVLVIFTVIFILIFALVALCRTLVTGPSETIRDQLVLSAMQASATKWLPGLFLDDELVAEICARSEEVQPETIPMGVLGSNNNNNGAETGDNSGQNTPNDPQPGDTPDTPDEWANAIDGMIYKTYTGPTFKAYILIVNDPSRVYVGTSSDYKSGKTGIRMFDIVEREGAIAAINAGEFEDVGGQGTGNNPIGLTYSRGKCVWDDNKKRTFIGFDDNGILHAVESITKSQADALGIRDAVSFQTGNVLITNDGEAVTLYRSEGNIGMAQRTAIAQRADGAVILVVTDGRTASSLGATRNDMIDLLVSEGAVVAGMLDGGSSTMMYYKDYYKKYDIDTSGLDEYQLQGLTNRYKAFTKPRRMPTYFLVSPENP